MSHLRVWTVAKRLLRSSIYMFTSIFDKISWNKIWKSLHCNVVSLIIFMHWIPLLGSAWLKPSTMHDPFPTPVSMLVAPVSKKRNLVLRTLYRGSGGSNYSSTLILFEQFCQRLYHGPEKREYFKLFFCVLFP